MNTIPLSPYSTDSEERITVPLLLAVASVVAACAIHLLVEPLHWAYSWLIDVPSVSGVFGILLYAFSNALWRVGWLRFPMGVQVPVLAGHWEGTFRSSFDDFKTVRNCSAEIRQGWLTMSVVFKSGESSSVSILAGISVKNAAGSQLSYCYVNTANYDKRLFNHDGTQYLVLRREAHHDVLEGEYYTNRKDGQTRGHMLLRRERV